MVSRNRVQQRTAEQFEEALISTRNRRGGEAVPRDRVQQRTAEQIEDAPQHPAAQSGYPGASSLEEIVNETADEQSGGGVLWQGRLFDQDG